MEHAVPSSELFNDSSRYAAIARLRKDLALPDYYPENPIYSPLSIGIEIEMTWRQAFPDLSQKYSESPNKLGRFSREYHEFSQEYSKHDKQLLPLLQRIEPVIPRVGNDAYWEFSFLPAHNMGVTDAELAVLYDTCILRDGNDYSLHMTVAGIDNDRDAFAFLCGLEQNGGSTPDRILEAMHSQKGAWARKGSGGIVKRRPDELMGNSTVGYEFRTLVGKSQEQINATLSTAAHLSQIHEQPEEWKEYRKETEGRLRAHGLEVKSWGSPRANEAPWLRYVELLDSVK